MHFARNADIGQPRLLIDALEPPGINTEGAIMIVGNGFHEVRGQSDSRMVEIFRAYEDASFLLLFTEESARAVDDLLQTGWNTYTPVSNTCTSDRGRACVRWRFPPFGAGRGPACQLDGMRDAGLVLPVNSAAARTACRS